MNMFFRSQKFLDSAQVCHQHVVPSVYCTSMQYIWSFGHNHSGQPCKTGQDFPFFFPA